MNKETLSPQEEENFLRLALLRFHFDNPYGSLFKILPKIIGVLTLGLAFWYGVNIIYSVLLGFLSYFVVTQIKNWALSSMFPIADSEKETLLKSFREILNEKDGAYTLYRLDYVSRQENINNPNAYEEIKKKIGK